MIAICLTFNLFKEGDFLPKAFAKTSAGTLTQTVAVPVNADGSINVKLAKSSGIVQVDVVQVNGYKMPSYTGELLVCDKCTRPHTH